MAIDRTDILELVATRLGFQDSSRDALISSYIPEIEYRILHYCNIEAVPDGLKYAWASMVIDVLRIEQPTVPEIEDTSGAGVDTKIGDTDVKQAQGSGLTNTSKSVIDAVVLNYRIDLNRYRKLRW